jgi:YD repeat-containing protein
MAQALDRGALTEVDLIDGTEHRFSYDDAES